LTKVKIDNINYSFDKNDYLNNLTIFQLAFNKDISIPCFCYHEKLTIAGNCRMCIVQINNNLGVSCAINVLDNMIIYTNNQRAQEARESVLEMLLINHL
jgi:NADH-quinone oxidoreductase subunit G